MLCIGNFAWMLYHILSGVSKEIRDGISFRRISNNQEETEIKDSGVLLLISTE
jgi:hypothetical protein